MKRLCLCLLIVLIACSKLFAQDNDLLLAKQYAANGDQQKALDIYQKLFKQNNEAFFTVYVNSLLGVKKFDDAISITKKMMRKHPEDHQYNIVLGTAYTQQGSVDKANAIYDDLIKNLPPDQGQIALLASLFYQNANVDCHKNVFAGA
jgi:tetratricopeptide (TPR) repeat protein